MLEQTEVRLEQMTLKTLFTEKQNLRIPDYQRVYSWRGTHVHDLLKDTFGRSTSYLMGTVILHKTQDERKNTCYEIVDGQQRLVTLTILLNQLNHKPEENLTSLPLLGGSFSQGSARVIRNTQKVIREFLTGKNDKEKIAYRNFLTGADEGKPGLLFSILVIEGNNALDRAYAFFDSVNSKGKPLTDFDLLKAHHLMFIPPKHEALASRHNDEWQNRDPNHGRVFSTTLRRLRMWGRIAERDSRDERPDYNEFSSVVEPEHGQTDEHLLNRYMQPVAFRSWRRVGGKVVLSMDYPAPEGEDLIPTEITQTIEGGDSFFIYAKRYHGLYELLFFDNKYALSSEIAFVRKLAEHIDNLYLQNAFRAVMLLYFDKFGEDKLVESAVCVEQIVSAWRWEVKSLRIEGTLRHVNGHRIVPKLLDSVNSHHAFSQLLCICQRLLPIGSDISGVRARYRESLTCFYEHERGEISDKRALELVNSFFNFNS